MNYKTIFLISVFIFILTIGFVSATDENATAELTLDGVQELQITDVDEEISVNESWGIEVEGPDELFYASYNIFNIHSKSGIEGRVSCYINNVSSTWAPIYNNSYDYDTTLDVQINEPGIYDVDFKYMLNGDLYLLKSFRYNVTHFETRLDSDCAINWEEILFTVIMPSEASGKVETTLNGKTYMKNKVFGDSYTDFAYDNKYVNVGKNPITINFIADSKSKYKSQTVKMNLIVYPSYLVSWQVGYLSDEGIMLYAPGLTGKLSFKVDDGDYQTVDVKDKIQIPLSDFTLGKHTVKSNYIFGDIKRENEKMDFDVVPDVQLPDFVKKGNEGFMTITLPDDANGNLSVSLNEKEFYSQSNAKGVIKIPLSDLLVKYNSMRVKYDDDNISYDWPFYVTCTKNSPDWDMKFDFENFVWICDIYEKDNQIGINTPNDYDGEITIYIDGKKVTSYEKYSINAHGWNGTDYISDWAYSYYYFDASKLKLGKHVMTVVGNGSKYYLPVNRTIQFTATNLYTEFDGTDIYYQQQKWSVDIPNDGTGTLKFYLDGKLIKTSKDSIISAIPENTKFGEHTLKFVYNGDKNYPKETITKKIKFTYRFHPKYRNWVFFQDKEFVVGNKNILPLAGPEDFKGKVSLTMGGKKITLTPKKGLVNFDLSGFKEGNYTAKVEYLGEGKFTKNSYNIDIEILPKLANIKANSTTLYYNSGKYIVKVLNNDGSPAQNVPVNLEVISFDETKNTDSNGIVKFDIYEGPGTYEAVITCKYSVVKKTIKIKPVVSLSKVKVKKSAKSLTLTATLKNDKGPIKSKYVTFKFNGKTVAKVKTNKKGVAKVTVKSSILKNLKVGKKVTYQAKYKDDVAKKTVNVIG